MPRLFCEERFLKALPTGGIVCQAPKLQEPKFKAGATGPAILNPLHRKNRTVGQCKKEWPSKISQDPLAIR